MALCEKQHPISLRIQPTDGMFPNRIKNQWTLMDLQRTLDCADAQTGLNINGLDVDAEQLLQLSNP